MKTVQAVTPKPDYNEWITMIYAVTGNANAKIKTK